MNKKDGSGAGVFMMEMLMAVFFFILCASVCILVFVKADSMSRLARDTGSGVLAAESVAEVWKAEGVSGLSDRFQAKAEAGQVSIYWDKAWTAVSEETEAAFGGVLSWEAEAGLETAQIAVFCMDQSKRELFSMTAARYLREGS